MASSNQDDIAIIGLSGVFAGSPNIDTFWRNILEKRDQICEAPDSWAMPWYDPEDQNQGIDSARIRTRKVGLLGDLAVFHPLEFGIPPKAVEGDPAHYLALQLAGDALRDAGYWDRDFNRERTGVILGHGSNPNRGDILGMQYGLVIDQTLDLLAQLMPDVSEERRNTLRAALKRSLPKIEIEQAPTLISNIISGRISNRLNLMGPNYLVDSACSSSLIALDLGMRDLRSGRCDMMLIGGVQASMPAQIYMLFQQIGALAHGDIRPFDASANGTLLGEGVGFAVIKRLADARRDGDRIYAILKGVGVASDGKGMGLLAPRVEGEALAIRRAYEQSGIDPTTIELIEAHGTGIPLGDRTELQALGQIFGERRGRLPHCAIGSVKSMIGHCIPAAGIASLIKTSLALHHKLLPPTLCESVNPDLGMERTPFYVNTATRPWVHGGPLPRRAGINAFGFGGINTHAILEEDRPPAALPPPGLGRWLLRHEAQAAASQEAGPMTSAATGHWSSELLVLRAELRDAMQSQISALIQRLSEPAAPTLAELAHELWRTQGEGAVRLALIASDCEDLRAKLEQLASKLPALKGARLSSRKGIHYAEGPGIKGKTAFLFSSEGAQYPNLLIDLARHFPQIRRWFDFLDDIFPRDPRPSDMLFPAPTTLDSETGDWLQSQLYAGDLATESVSMASHALYELLRDFGIQCDIMVGHSAGEHVALRASGKAGTPSMERFKEELRLLNGLYETLNTEQALSTGSLISLGGIAQEAISSLLQEFSGSLHLVADNCPNQVLLFISEEQRSTLIERLVELGGIYSEMPFDRAYHTPLFAAGANALRQFYEKTIALSESSVPVYSCSTAQPYPDSAQDTLEIAAMQWVRPVLFRDTIERLYEEGVRLFIEVGPSNSLTAFVENILKGRDYRAIATNTQAAPSLEHLQQALGQLFVEQVPLDLTPMYAGRSRAENSRAENPGLRMQLAGELPRIRVDDEFADDWKTAAAAKMQDGRHEPLPENQQNSTQQDLQIMQKHFELMQYFLENQEKVSAILKCALNPKNSD